MAIFGDLSDMSTPEVLTILGRRTGKLLIDLPGPTRYELHLCEATLWSLQVDGTAHMELPVVFYHLAILNRAREGRFEFVGTTLSALEHQLDLPRQELLARDDGGDEALEKSAIPDKQTRFRLRPGASQAVPENLQVFLQQSQALLARGSSAEEVAQGLGMSAMRVQIYFQRLRVLGRITPVRAYAAPDRKDYGNNYSRDYSEAYGGTPRGETSVSLPAASRPAPNRPAITRDSYTHITPDKPPRSLVRRLLSVLTLGAIR